MTASTLRMMSYDDYNPDEMAKVVTRAVRMLNKHKGEFDSIVVRGVSGLMIGAPVALKMGKPLLVVRKPNELRHTSVPIANHVRSGDRYIILDDFVSSGVTARSIAYAMKKDRPKAQLVATYMYQSNQYLTSSDPAFLMRG